MTKINLKKFEKNIVVRPLRMSDWEGVVALQKRCFPGMEPWSTEQFGSQLKIFPEGQIGVEYQGKLVASSGSVVLDFELYKDWHSHEEISDSGVPFLKDIPIIGNLFKRQTRSRDRKSVV